MNAPIHSAIFTEPAPYWQPGVDDTLECVAVHDETHDVRTFTFRAVPARRFAYLPGQFITLELEIDGQTVNRCYTLSSTPTRPDTVTITVKRVPGGQVSNWLHDNMKPGQLVSVLGPSGEFSYASAPVRSYLFLSAGSGITPLMSMSRALADLGPQLDIAFVHSARTPADLIFRHELVQIARMRPGFRQAAIVQSRHPEPEWHGLEGFLDLPALERLVPDFRQRAVYCCGPAPYMSAVRKLLTDAGYDMALYHEESFNFAELAASPVVEEAGCQAETAGCEGGFEVRFAKLGDVITTAPGQTVLAAAQQQGLRLPSSCSQGVCGTCKTKLLEGKVDMKHGGGIRQREIDQGWILPCCSIPLTPLVLDR
ncbi:hybrid-cluster NAD(P)-dependent oxidoreductase [Pseudogulbenkiania ferrooxidans]|uniref:Oxidoreductase FAD-binding domain protein n=1 Tax=Pseudogulbenkiania ferrooxidans 2002 TaxID=279714 RepID=B9Z0C3_9NEIS|nr:hybrid-cluster NAD(P)-dependent oxidoreductase [Pseudogulbenkiania ferrooxidans]EEG10006.1 Oxidoreductase FAD-binding domain protein [Pseudogulbenkiania ferrooxidans 2002]